MITLKMLVRPQKMRKDNTWNVNLRISFERKTTFISTPYYVTKAQINKNFEIKDRFLQIQIDEDLNRARREVAESFQILSGLTTSQIGNHLSNFLYTKKKKSINFFEFADRLLEEFNEVGKSSRGNYKITFNKLRLFVGHNNLGFDGITVSFLRDFDSWLRENSVGSRGRALYFSNLRATINIAMDRYNDDENDVYLIKNPFKKFALPRVNEPEKRALSIRQLKALINYIPEKSTIQFGKDVFLLSFYLVGMNTKDLYEVKSQCEGRITYNRSKTSWQRQDKALISIKIEPEAQEIIDRYKDPSGQRLFNFHNRYADAQNFNKYVNEYLKPIGEAIGVEDLQFYAARHTWATLFVNECGGSESDAAFCLNHVTEHKITSGYIKKDFARIDRANRKVLDYVMRHIL